MSWFVILALAILFIGFVIAAGLVAHVWAIVFLLSGIVLFDYATDFQLYHWINNHNFWIMLAYYGVIGLAVCVIQWILYNFRVSRKFTTFRNTFDDWWESNGKRMEARDGLSITTKRKHFVEQWNSEMCNSSLRVSRNKIDQWGPHLFVPQAKRHIGLITMWIVAWPSVVIEMVMSDLIVKCSKHVAVLFDLLLSKTFSRLFKKQLTDL